MTQETCKECGSSELVYGVKIKHSTEAGHIGLEYRSGLIFSGAERLLADLCNHCGTIHRFWVRRTDRSWNTKD
ncbi:MAG: hypothetical protein ACYS26_19975 [Planctomycetota bacterium]|jgi:RNase P subunit RPR2